MAHPDLLIGPSLAVARRAASPGETRSIARHRRRRLESSEIGRHVPPFDADSPDAGRDRRERKSPCRGRRVQIRRPSMPSPAKPCASARFAAEPESQRAAREGAAGYRKLYRSSAKILISAAGCMRASLSTGSSAASSAASMATPSKFEQLQREHMQTAAASRTPSHSPPRSGTTPPAGPAAAPAGP